MPGHRSPAASAWRPEHAHPPVELRLGRLGAAQEAT